ncbi:minor capsid protein [Bacillus cereus]|jgi:hypothetical protein|uniref:Minor capsid protein n=2 Tax=root TaxID=1 RepID=A0A1Z1LZM6_9CAUD|nr:MULTISPECIES: minor capsid protein [Bacilli]YP_009833663.1 minor head protein [Bacillus phage Deep-Purple]MED1835405.1 minor capsid protein [Bacillus thuringiensis]ARW58273.1 minor capsid protein [Bacillus phage Deep-Purple]PDZ59376.1 minor capsid protein [Bacillus cereus]PEE91370.1 minor capsid protein [Bacillus cereus]PGN76087.1 minor capsid protein [Bacillus cereus]
MITTNIRIDTSHVEQKFDGAVKKAQRAFSQQVLADSNYYIPMDTTATMQSSLIASDMDKGNLLWTTPYASDIYWNPQYNFHKDKNPNASGLWFEKAKSSKLPYWVNFAGEAIKSNI